LGDADAWLQLEAGVDGCATFETSVIVISALPGAVCVTRADICHD
jgi:hypothetical protein